MPAAVAAIDQNEPAAAGLISRTTIFDLDLAAAKDHAVWKHAAATSAVIVTKGEDFAVRVQRLAR